MLAHLMGIRPWEHGLLTVDQFDTACRSIDQYQRDIERANKQQLNSD